MLRIAQDCTTDILYLTFSDGTIYAYAGDSLKTASAIITSYNHGVTFNSLFRRAVNLRDAAGYEEVSVIPITARGLYTFPPYPGLQPPPCPMNIFDAALWVNTILGTGAVGPSITPPTGGVGSAGEVIVPGTMAGQAGSAQNNFTLTYTGPGGPGMVTWTFDVTNAVLAGQSVGYNLNQGGTVLLSRVQTGDGSFSGMDAFTLAPGVGANQTITGGVVCNVGVSNAGLPSLSSQAMFERIE